MDSVEKLKESTDSILAGEGTLETLTRMREYVCQIAGGSVPWHMSEKQLNLELFDVLRRVWNFSLRLERTTKKTERGEYFGMLRYFCVGIVLFLVVERGVNEAVDPEKKEQQQQYIPGAEEEDDNDDVTTANKLKALSTFQLLKMTLNAGRVCLDYVPDAEKAQHCFQIVNEHYGKIRDADKPEDIQMVLREIIRILYADGKKIFQLETEDQEVLKDLLTAASVLAKDCQDEGSCLGALCLRNGVRLAGMGRHWKAAVWLTAATWNAHFLDDQNHALARRKLAQVYFDLGVINDFPDVIAGLDRANTLSFSPSGGLLKLKILLSSASKTRPSKDPLDAEIESQIADLLDRVQISLVAFIVDELENLGFHSAAMFALDCALAPTRSASFLANCDSDVVPHFLNLFLIRVNKSLAKEDRAVSKQLPRKDSITTQSCRQQQLLLHRNLYRFLTDESVRRFHDDDDQLPTATAAGKSRRRLPPSLHPTLWNLAKACVNRGDLRESVDWYLLSFQLLSSSSASSSSSFQSKGGQSLRRRVEGKLRRNLAKCFVGLGDFAAASEQVEASLRLDPNCLLSLYRNYTVHLHSGRDLNSTLRAFDRLFIVVADDRHRSGGGGGVKTTPGERPFPASGGVDNDGEDDHDGGDSVNVESVISLALDETFKSSRLDVVEGVIERSLSETRRAKLSVQTHLVVLRRALQLLFQRQDPASTTRRIGYLEMAFDILKENIQKSNGERDQGLRQAMLSEVDWFTPMAWNTIGSSKTDASMENFMLTFKFLALMEIKIRESLHFNDASGGRGGGGGGGDGGAAAADESMQEDEENRQRLESATTIKLQVNLHRQNDMLANAVDAGLRRVRALSAGSYSGFRRDESSSSSSPSAAASLTENLEMLYKICEKRRRVLTELESVSGAASSSLLRCKLDASMYHFEVCAKSRRHSQMESLLGEIARLAGETERNSFPAFAVFESLVGFCVEPPADRRLNRLVACECFIRAMKLHAAAAMKRPTSNPTSATHHHRVPTLLPSLPKIFEDALDFVASVSGFPKDEMTAVADGMSGGFFQFLAASSSFSPPPSEEASSSLSTLAEKSFDLGLRCRREGEDEAATKWLRLSLDLANKGGAQELQNKTLMQLESIAKAAQKQ